MGMWCDHLPSRSNEYRYFVSDIQRGCCIRNKKVSDLDVGAPCEPYPQKVSKGKESGGLICVENVKILRFIFRSQPPITGATKAKSMKGWGSQFLGPRKGGKRGLRGGWDKHLRLLQSCSLTMMESWDDAAA